MLCPESSLAVKLIACKKKNMEFYRGICKQKSGDCSSQRKINVNLIFEGSENPEFTQFTNSQLPKKFSSY